jgi:uncharacterized membrane protein SpoIIM required for sporulation
MNIERWIKLRRPSWDKLESLLKTIDTKSARYLTRKDLQELGRLYRTTSADLSRARAWNINRETVVYLNHLVVKAHNQVYRSPQNRWRDLANFLWFDFPLLVQKRVLYVAAAFAIFVAGVVTSDVYVQKDIHYAQLEMSSGQPLIPEDMWHIIEQRKLWTDSAQNASPLASSMIATNNIRVCVLSFATGITFGVGTVIVLLVNGLSIGTVLGICKHYGIDGPLLTFVAPHGVLELTSIFISGGAGFVMGVALLFPGKVKRLEALRMVARDALTLFAGCLPLLCLAGLIEGFISPRTDIDPNTKYLVSLTTLLFLVFYFFLPRRKKEESDRPIEPKTRAHPGAGVVAPPAAQQASAGATPN